MKTAIKIPTLLVFLCCALATPAVFGADGTWTGAGDGTNLAVAANWTPALPGTAGADVAFWNGYTNGAPATNLVLHYNNAGWASGFQSSGVNLYFTSNQVGSVTIMSDLAGFSSPIAIWNITNDIGAGAFTFGGTDSGHIINWIGRPQGNTGFGQPFHTMMNNSTNVATLTPWIQFTAGGAVTWTLDFQGTGNWQANSHLVNNNGAGMILQVDGPGKMFWNPQGYLGANGLNSPITINSAGTMVLQGNSPKLGNQAFTLAGIFMFDAPSQVQTLTGVISGAGQVWVGNGALTLSGANTFSGGVVLTNNGTVILNRAETDGVSGPLGNFSFIYFHGGTLQWSGANTFDYSANSRIFVEDGAHYNFNTGGQTVTLAGDLFGTGSTLSQTGPGNLFLTGGADYTGLTTINSGKLVFQSQKSGSGDITVADGGTLGVYADWQTTPGTLSLGTSAGCVVEFNNVSSTSTAPLVANTITNNGTVTINVNSGTFNTIGAHYPLISWTTGNPPAVALGNLNGANGILVTNGNTIQLNITATAFVWTGLGNALWDTASTGNWRQSGSDAIFANGAPALINDLGSVTTVTLNDAVQPTSTTVDNDVLDYTIISSSGKDLAGSGGLTKDGTHTLTMVGGANTYTGVTTLSAGTLSVSNLANGGSASDIGAANNGAASVVLNGGTLQYTGSGASIDRLFTVNATGGTIDASGSGSLNFTGTGTIGVPGSGTHGLTLTGSDTNGETIAATLANGSAGVLSLTKNGANTWSLTGANTYSGLTTISAGTLQIGTGGASGSLGSGNVANGSRLVLNRSGSLTVSGNITGAGSVRVGGGGTISLGGNDLYSGGTTISNGTTLQLTGSGTLNPNVNIVNNGTFVMNSSTPLNISGFQTGISGSGNVIVSANRSLALIDWATFSGWLLINSGATFQPYFGNEGNFWCSVVTNNGTLFFSRQDGGVAIYSNNIVGSGKVVKENNNANSGDVTLGGTNNTYTGGTWIAGGGIILGGHYNTIIDTNALTTNVVYVAGGNIVGNVYFTNTTTTFLNSRYLTFNRNDNITFGGNIVGAVSDASAVFNQGSVIQEGAGMLTLTGNNTYRAGTTISNGVLQIGNGGTTGSVGSGGVNIQNATSTLVFNRANDVTFSNAISGPGSIVQNGSGTVTLPGTNNSYSGTTTINSGILAITGEVTPGNVVVSNTVNVLGGKLVAGPLGSQDTLTVGLGSLNVTNGIIYVGVNTSMAQTSTHISFPFGPFFASNATLEVINYGPALHAGDSFNVFDTGAFMDPPGALFKFISPGVTFTDNQDGSITVASVATGTPSVSTSVSGGQLTMSWPSVWTGLHMQVQTNTLAKGLGTNWFTIPGTDLSNSYTAPIVKNTNNASVFYRLAP